MRHRQEPCDSQRYRSWPTELWCPAVEQALVYGRLTRGVNLTAASPEESVTMDLAPRQECYRERDSFHVNDGSSECPASFK